MRLHQRNERRGVILLVVLSLLTLFAIVGITFVLYSDSEAAAARVAREAETAQRADVDPEQALAFFLGQFIYDVDDNDFNSVVGSGGPSGGLISGLRGHSLARTMYGYNYAAPGVPGINLVPYSGVGRYHYASPLQYPATPLTNVPNSFGNSLDDYALVNYTWFSGDGFIRDPERYGTRTNAQAQSGTQPNPPNPYVGGNAPYTYPDLNNFFLAAVRAPTPNDYATNTSIVLTPSYHRKWLFNPNNNFNDMTNANWTNAQGKYLTPRPRPNEHPLFPIPDDATGDVKNLVWAPGGNDSIWIDLGAPVMTAPDGTQYKMLFAPLIMDLDGRINLNACGNILGLQNSLLNNTPPPPPQLLHVSNQGFGAWEVNLSKVLYADSGSNPPIPEYINLFMGRNLGASTIYGRYGANFVPSTPNANAPSGTPAHTYAQGDVNGYNETAAPPGSSPSSRPAPAGFAPNVPNMGNPPPSPIFPQYLQGYLNGGTELTNHPLLYSIFRPAVFNGTDDRVFRASDMEALLRPNSITGSAVDAGSAALLSDLIRLCPQNLGPSAASPRYRNLVTTLSMDLGAPAVSPYWWNGMQAQSYLAVNPNGAQFAPFGQAAPFPALPPTAAITNPVGTNPPTSEFGPDWRAVSANPATYVPSTYPPGPPPYTTPGGRIRLNRPLPPYPHMGTGATPPYSFQPPNNASSPYGSAYGVAYNLGNANINSQYTAALNARQALANDIYRRLLAVAGIAAPGNTAAPAATDLAPRRWLAQLAVNIVDFIDEDDISTPFNFYNTTDGLPAAQIGATQGGDDPIPTGANPLYWVFGTELPKVVLNEVLAEAQNSVVGATLPTGVTITESVKVWLELFNTMPAAVATNAQPQDAYRVPLYMTNPTGVPYSPYRITIAQTMMNLPPPTFTIASSPLPDISANVLGKPFIASPPFPQSTTDVDFSVVVPTSQSLATPPGAPATQAPFTVPVSGNTINAGVDPQNFFVIGPKTIPPNPNPLNRGTPPYQNPFVSPGLPNNIPVLQTDNMSYTPTWLATSTTDERITGLTVLLRRLANPYLPLQVNPALPYYNPYVTVDYVQNVPIQSNLGLIQNPVLPPTYSSRGKTQPYAGLTQVTLTGKVPQAPSGSNVLAGSPVVNQAPNANPPPTGAATVNNVINTFGYTNYPLPPSGHYDWLVHLDRPVISPMELLHVSGYQPYQLTQQFMLGADNVATSMFGHYAPWLDAPPGPIGNMSTPWWFDSSLTAGQQSHRLYRLFEFFESGDWATGVNGLGRIPGKVNISTIWDAEILQALIDANLSMGINANSPNTPTNPADPVYMIFQNMLASRSPNYVANGTIGPVNMGSPGGDDHPFLPLSAGLYTPGAGTQYPNGISVASDTLLRLNPNANTLLLFQNPGAPAATPPIPADTSATHPYLQTQLLTKLYNNVTTRSNTFAVFLTVGFFQVIPGGAVGQSNVPQLGPEIGRSEGRQVRHRMFALVDRTNLAAFTNATAMSVTGPTLTGSSPNNPPNQPPPPNPNGNAWITLSPGWGPAGSTTTATYTNPNRGYTWTIQSGSQLVIEPGTANEETIVVQSVSVSNNANPLTNQVTITANFAKQHPNPAVTGNPNPTYLVIQRGNPGPQPAYNSRPQPAYDPRQDPYVVPYYSLID